MTDMALETDALGKRYGPAWALRGCSLRLPAGRIVALVGPNGAGKSTLLHLAVGLLRPDEGNVTVLGQNSSRNRPVLTDTGFVAQDAPLYQDFTATELITMGGKLNRRRWDAGYARGHLARAGIPLDRRVSTLSGGQRAQVALALALAKRPRLLLLDEPIAALDPLARHEFMQALMGAVAETGATVLLSSHLLTDLERTCDHLVVLRDGRVQLAGSIDDLLGEHRVLVGPRTQEPVPGVAKVIRASHTDRQSTLLVRTAGPVTDPTWHVGEPTLEDIVLAHLAVTAPAAGPASEVAA
ncbi:ABC transporter ATP-binding protein [Streptomyces sp. NPDC001982]|uniref:ABC transporter ATP-binding protein n=1 Tax=Streptomyces sp. NPDC001982 TaxID=3154405 RepID=UPI003328FAC9